MWMIGVIAGVFVVALVIVALLLCLKKRRSDAKASSSSLGAWQQQLEASAMGSETAQTAALRIAKEDETEGFDSSDKL
jgi:hypothetical protein